MSAYDEVMMACEPDLKDLSRCWEGVTSNCAELALQGKVTAETSSDCLRFAIEARGLVFNGVFLWLEASRQEGILLLPLLPAPPRALELSEKA